MLLNRYHPALWPHAELAAIGDTVFPEVERGPELTGDVIRRHSLYVGVTWKPEAMTAPRLLDVGHTFARLLEQHLTDGLDVFELGPLRVLNARVRGDRPSMADVDAHPGKFIFCSLLEVPHLVMDDGQISVRAADSDDEVVVLRAFCALIPKGEPLWKQ